MCGRFALHFPKPKLEQALKITIPFDIEPRFNIAPTQKTLVLIGEDKMPQMMEWGFLPFWAKDKKITPQINAKAETIDEKPMFKNAFHKHRCIVIASGFYEWKEQEAPNQKLKVPYFISDTEEEIFCFAAIWDRCPKEKGEHIGFTILTTDASNQMAKIHSRMPAILNEADVDVWLDMRSSQDALKKCLIPYKSNHLQLKQVSRYVNNPLHDDPQCLL